PEDATKGRQARPEVLSPFTTVRDFGVEPSEEKEWRVVYDPTADDTGDQYQALMSYAITPKGIQPKLKLRLGTKSVGKPLHLEEIVEAILLGPTGGSAIAQHAMRRLCTAAGKPRLSGKVHSSRTPYRP
ncbi:hypothetical protein, partial [Stenotrophomonas maltophilia]|uniref:hypothetical protein n=1 Tax=Stenotrophomonas maltophilia TaxID=40324 RepID=UPI00209A6E17